jgi:hypothetical protein
MSIQTDVKVGQVVLSDEAASAVDDYSRLGQQIKALQAKRDAARDQILAGLAGAPEGTYNGVLRVAVTEVTRTDIDGKALLAAFPEAYAATAKVSTHPRIYPK